MQHIGGWTLRGDAGRCTRPRLAAIGLRALALGLLVLFAVTEPAAAQGINPLRQCRAEDHLQCDDGNPCTVDRCSDVVVNPWTPTGRTFASCP